MYNWRQFIELGACKYNGNEQIHKKSLSFIKLALSTAILAVQWNHFMLFFWEYAEGQSTFFGNCLLPTSKHSEVQDICIQILGSVITERIKKSVFFLFV